MTLSSVALRNLARHRLRTAITLGAIGAGGAAMIFIGGYFDDTLTKMRASYIEAHTRHIQIFRRGFNEHGHQNPLHYMIEDPEILRACLKQDPRVASVAPHMQFAALLSSGQKILACSVEAGDLDGPDIPAPLKTPYHTYVKGVLLEAGALLRESDPFGVLIGQALADRLHLRVGDPVTLMGSTPSGAVNAFDGVVQGVFITSSKAYDEHVIRIPLSGAHQLLRTTAVQSLIITLRRTEDTDAARRDLDTLISSKKLDLETKTWEELNDFYFKARVFFMEIFLVLRIVIIVLVVMCIYNTMILNVLERTSEIATLRALGRTPADIVRLFMLEGAWLGAAGGMISVAAGIALTGIIGHVGIQMPPPPGGTVEWVSRPTVVASEVLLALLICVAASIVSAVLPAMRAARLSIADGLRSVA